MTDIKIEKNVPMPEARGETIYPFSDMEVGDSFFVPGRTPNQMQNSASHWRKKNGWKFTTARENDGTRIWRKE
jgi:hypothetical protein